MSMRLVGMMVAGLLAGVVLALIGVAYLTAPPPTTPTVAPTPSIDTMPAPPIADPSTDGNTQESSGDFANAATSIEGAMEEVRDWTYRAADAKGNPQTLVTASNFKPAGRGLYTLTDVRASFFRDGRVVRLRADEGEIRGQRGEEPESGLLTGDVSIALYPAGATEADAIAHEQDAGGVAPEIAFTTNQMRFDTTLGQGVAPGQVMISGPGIRLDGRGLTIRFGTESGSDDPTLLLVRLDASDGLQLWPDRLPRNDQRSRPSGEASHDAGENRTNPEAPVDPTVYAFRLSGDVAIARSSYTLRADALEAHARLFGGSLRADAIAPIRMREEDPGTPETRRATGAPDAPDYRQPEAPILVTWNGPLELSPVLNPPGVLDYDDVAVRFISDREEGVRLGDDLAGVSLAARTITYFATGALFEARAGSPRGVVIDAERVAQLACSSLDVDLSDSPAIRAFARTPGVATDAQGRSLRWNGRADASALMGRDRLIPVALDLSGGVDLATASDTAGARNLRIAFDPEGRPQRIEAWEDVRAEQHDHGRSITGDRATLTLANDDGRPTLTRTEVTGVVRARDGERTFQAQSMIADFEASDVTHVSAERGVLVTLENGLAISCERLNSDRGRGTIDLVGTDDAPVSVTRNDDVLTLHASVGSARVEETRERITGFGPGAGTMTTDDPSAPYRAASMTWGGGFVFDAQQERLELLGGVGIRAEQDDDETHTARAERAEIDLAGVDAQATRVVGARLYAGPGPDGEEIPATAEARRTRQDPDAQDGERVLESLLNIRSGELLVDVDAQTVDAPGAGRLVVEDQREPDPDATSNDADTRGTSVFRWTGAMALQLDAGTASLERDVSVRHLPRNADDVTQLDCQRLDAYFAPSDANGGRGFTINRLVARESVYAGYRGLELLADSLEYLASREQITAEASPGNRVTVFDPDRAGHYTASSVLIDLVTGNWTSSGATGAGGAP
ncbi:MAG: hypothetical protein Tsb0013_14660 [Phycisphaerales bacterium]